MIMPSIAEIPMSSIIRNVVMSIRVTGQSKAVFRLKVAEWVLRLAAKIAGCKVYIKMECPEE